MTSRASAAIWLAASLWPETRPRGLWANPWPQTGCRARPAARGDGAGAADRRGLGGRASAVRDPMAGEMLTGRTRYEPAARRQMIGRLERVMILTLLLHNQPDGIGPHRAPPILRFSGGERRRPWRASEYVIIGTLASCPGEIAAAFATNALLAAFAERLIAHGKTG